MATCSGKQSRKVMQLGSLILMLMILLASNIKSLTVEGAVTVLNPAAVMQVSLVVDGNSVKVDAPIMNVDVSWKGSQNISVNMPNGNDMDVAVKDGDVLVLMPDFTGDSRGIVVQINGNNAPPPA